ncbi:hypothetical protein H9L14_07300 [Sphingomonas sediminicola]|uniref:Uncharacterized protein n=1 Tax=Sphingomonas sediminicola TaxID=386874 RepID=A0ABX6TB25_9SPHN|nr:hypothetical protein H9L14_07300 [Sphingomonas sediminicola]
MPTLTFPQSRTPGPMWTPSPMTQSWSIEQAVLRMTPRPIVASAIAGGACGKESSTAKLSQH